MTLVVCPSLALDRLLHLDRLVPGRLQRPTCLQQQAGGKGTNVLRALHALGGQGTLAGFAAGRIGRLIGELAGDEGFEVELVTLAGEARICTVLMEDDGRHTDLFELGPSISAADELALVEAVRDRPAGENEWAVLTGAAPLGARPGFYATLTHALKQAGYRLLLDAAGEQLAQALLVGPDLLKINREEAAGIAGPIASSWEGVADGCRRLVAHGASAVVITRGARGGLALEGGLLASVTTPPVSTLNATGSGDCFAAALALQLERGAELLAALPLAAGAGAANAVTEGTAQFDATLAQRLADAARLRTRPA